jgi:GNAT superfamily N-acetyltransferase
MDVTHLVNESKELGFRFLERLVTDYREGRNTFNQPGEALYGVYNEFNELVAIGGLNIDPNYNNLKVGRLRRFYVAKDYRRKGIGSLLLNKIRLDAKRHFETLVLHTDTVQADRFYLAYGFKKNLDDPNSTHYLNL